MKTEDGELAVLGNVVQVYSYRGKNIWADSVSRGGKEKRPAGWEWSELQREPLLLSEVVVVINWQETVREALRRHDFRKTMKVWNSYHGQWKMRQLRLPFWTKSRTQFMLESMDFYTITPCVWHFLKTFSRSKSLQLD